MVCRAPQSQARSSSHLPDQKLVVFTEHRDTLNYLQNRMVTLLGREEAVVVIHGGIGREDRRAIQESFRHDPSVQVLLATDAASEGINLQRAHLMVNYDLPWNPNRIEQRFGRIHRIGQTKVCHLWNLIAEETREGDVYHTLLKKLEEARHALGGQVFDVLGKLQFEGKPLRDLLLEAVRYGELPDVQARLTQVVSDAFDRGQVQDLLEESALARESMDTTRVHRIREEMERAEVRRLQPHYVEAFFLEAFKLLGGRIVEREPRRYHVSHVPRADPPARPPHRTRRAGPSAVRPHHLREVTRSRAGEAASRLRLSRPRAAGRHHRPGAGASSRLAPPGGRARGRQRPRREAAHAPLPGAQHPRRQPHPLGRAADSLEARPLRGAWTRTGTPSHRNTRPTSTTALSGKTSPASARSSTGPSALGSGARPRRRRWRFAVSEVVPGHLAEVRSRKLELLDKTEAAVKERLTKEIAYWDHRAAELLDQERAGKTNARLNSGEASRRADDLQGRLQKRMDEIRRERQLSPMPPVVTGGVLVVPAGLIRKMTGSTEMVTMRDRQAAAARARKAVMKVERNLGFEPVDRETDKLGYDIESRVPGTGKLRFIEVKGRQEGAATVTVTKNEILTSLNKPDDFILAIVELRDSGEDTIHYVRQPFRREPDFGAASVNYELAEALLGPG